MAIGDELSNLSFEAMIGGPLVAVIKAQAMSAMTSVDFIKSVGFSQSESGVETPTMVTFSYDRVVMEPASSGSSELEPHIRKFNLSVPILTMLPVPFLLVEETTIDFNARITSMEETATTTSKDLTTSLKAKGGWGPVSAKLSVNYAYKRSTSTGSKVERTYSIAVHVRAFAREVPTGTERLLTILERNITETRAPDPTPPTPARRGTIPPA